MFSTEDYADLKFNNTTDGVLKFPSGQKPKNELWRLESNSDINPIWCFGVFPPFFHSAHTHTHTHMHT